jgi:hypothetical protein
MLSDTTNTLITLEAEYQTVYGQALSPVQQTAVQNELASGETVRATDAPWAIDAQAKGEGPGTSQLTRAQGLLAAGASEQAIAASFLPASSSPLMVWLTPVPDVKQTLLGESATSDFLSMFAPEAPWASAALNDSVLTVLEPEQNDSDAILKQLSINLNKNHIALAMAGLMSQLGGPNGTAIGPDGNWICIGIEGFTGYPMITAVDRIEPLLGGHVSTATNAPQWSISQVAEYITPNVQAALTVYPDCQQFKAYFGGGSSGASRQVDRPNDRQNVVGEIGSIAHPKRRRHHHLVKLLNIRNAG